jgi:protocatechuate 3,4-dioxygenase alpha subunit
VPDPAFRGFGRLPTDQDGIATFETVRPGRVPGLDGSLQALDVNVHIFSRGMLQHVLTRIYFADDLANAEDAILLLVDSVRRRTLLACPDPNESSKWRIDFHLCGDCETVFFDI